jgi:hypothetical protein
MYLLLRNNKQSGPYSLDDLKSMGLKAYDLVWLEGKSAAWRYPSELEELKAFAPAVEEQPFDRFYRRPAPATATAANAAGATLSSKAPAADAPIPVTVESSKAPGKRIIYVTMPAARNGRDPVQPAVQPTPAARETVQPVRETAQSVGEIAQPARETAQPIRETAQAAREPIQPVREVAYAGHEPAQPARESQTMREPRPRVIEDYSAHQAGDQAIIEEFFPRKKRSPRVIRLLTIAICILALLAAGIIIGLNLNRDTLGLSAREVAKVPPATTDQTIVHPAVQPLPAPAATAPALTTDSAKAAGAPPTVAGQPNTTTHEVAKTTPKAPGFKTQKERPSHLTKPNVLPPVKDSTAGMANAIHRAQVVEPLHNNTELADKEAIKAALASQVSVGANGYSVGTFGGITDLQLTVTNRSAYPLDLVIVEVQYVQANKKIFKTADLYFRGIGAGSALMQEAPKSSRGVRVQYKIMSITSKEVAYSYNGI